MSSNQKEVQKAIKEAMAIMHTEGFFITPDDVVMSLSRLEEEEKVYTYGRFSKNYGGPLCDRRDQSTSLKK